MSPILINILSNLLLTYAIYYSFYLMICEYGGIMCTIKFNSIIIHKNLGIFMDQLKALTSLDGRYHNATQELQDIFSESCPIQPLKLCPMQQIFLPDFHF